MIPVAISKIFASVSRRKTQTIARLRTNASLQAAETALPNLSRDEAKAEMARLNQEISAAEQSLAVAQRNLNAVRKDQTALDAEYDDFLRRQKFDEAGKIRSKIEGAKDRVRSAELALQDAQSALDRLVEQRRTISKILGRFDTEEWTKQIREDIQRDLVAAETAIKDRLLATDRANAAILRLLEFSKQLRQAHPDLADECDRAATDAISHARGLLFSPRQQAEHDSPNFVRKVRN